MKDLSSLQHFIGCDVSKDTLDFAIHERQKDYRSFPHLQVSNNLDGFRKMRNWLKNIGLDAKRSVVAMEHTGLYSEALSEWCHKQHITFVMLHALDVKNAHSRGRNKTDKEDSQFIADYVYTHREKLSPSEPVPPIIKELRRLMNERSLAVKSRNSYQNQIKGIGDRSSLNRMNKMILAFKEQIKMIEKKLKSLIESDESISVNFNLILSVPGIGFINAVSTIVATSNFTRFQTARQYAKFICVSPISKESGKTIREGNHVIKAGHGELKAILTEAARSAVTHDPQMRIYYQRKRNEGKSHGCVMNAVKFKLVCRMFAVIKRQHPFVDIDKFRA